MHAALSPAGIVKTIYQKLGNFFLIHFLDKYLDIRCVSFI